MNKKPSALLSLSTLAVMSFLFVSVPAHADDLYRCEADGKVQYSQTPCPPAAKQAVQTAGGALSTAQSQRARQQLAQDKQQADELRKQRLSAEQKHDAAMRKQIAKTEKQKKMCGQTQLKVKWAKEDLQQASPKAEQKARQKLKRAEEKASLACAA